MSCVWPYYRFIVVISLIPISSLQLDNELKDFLISLNFGNYPYGLFYYLVESEGDTESYD